MERRNFINFLASFGLGAFAAELYEKLYNLPLLQKNFREEIEYWMKQYEASKKELDSLKGERDSLEEILEQQDSLEKESVSSLELLYKERMEEAINGLRRTVEKYKVILGEERVSFESSTLKVLEELKMAREKLDKISTYFPLIKDLSWEPEKIINGKIYDLSVTFEVLSPFNSLREIEITLFPVEYRYFITRFGMSEEDYRLVFPSEEVRSVKIKPKGIEQETFSAEFKDLRGGREYIITAKVKDTSGKEKFRELKIPYIREFENVSSSSNVLIGAYYYPWYSPDRHWKEGYIGRPLLGEYDSRDSIVISKHIDWVTGHGISVFLVSWWGPDSWEDRSIKELLKTPLSKDIKIGIFYETLGRLRAERDEINLDDEENRNILLNDFNYLAKTYFNTPSYFKFLGPVVGLYLARIFKGNISETIETLREEIKKLRYNLFLIGDIVYWENPEMQIRRSIEAYDAITPYNMHTNVKEILDNFERNVAEKYNQWKSAAEKLKIGFIPSALPGYDDRAVRSGNMPLPKNVDRFEKQLEIAKSSLDKDLRMIMITSWNEWHENTYVEPSREEKFEYLKVIKKCM